MIWRNFFWLYLFAVVSLPAVAWADDSVRSDAVGAVMAGEFGFQSGQYAQAAQNYVRAAQSSPELLVVERAARMAVLAGDDALLAQALSRWQQLQPDSDLRAGLALRLALRSQQGPAARAEAESLLEHGDSGLKMLRDSLLDARGGSALLARQVLREVMASDRWQAGFGTWLGLAGLARQMLVPADVGVLLKRLPAKFAGEPRALLALALWQREQGDAAAAFATLDSMSPAQVTRDADRRQFVAELVVLRRYAEAERWLASGDQDTKSYRQRLALLERANSAVALSAVVTQLKTDRGLAAGIRSLLLGQAAELASDWPAAERHYRDVRNGVERSEAQFRQVVVLQKQARTADALKLLRKLQRDRHSSAEARRDAFVVEASMLKSAPGDADIEAYDRGLASFAGDAKLLYGRAMRYVETGRVDAGLADLRRILDAEPGHVAALNAYGYVLAEQKQEYSKALPFVEQALRLQPDSPAILDSLGYIHLRQGKHADALPLLQRAWTLQPDPEVAAHLGELLWLTGRRDEAGKVWREGLALEPANRSILALQEKLRP